MTEDNQQELDAYISTHRLSVKPNFNVLVSAYITARLSSEDETATEYHTAIIKIADSFKRVFAESSLKLRADHFSQWSNAEVREKQRADLLLASGIEIRSGADSRAQALSLFEEAESIYTTLGDESGRAEVLGQKGFVNWSLDRDLYFSFNTEALALRRAVDDQQLVANSLNDLGLYNLYISRDYEQALAVYLESERIRWEIGDSVAQSRMLPNIGIAYERTGDYAKTQKYYLAAADLYLAVGEKARSIGQRNNAAGILTDYLGRHSEAIYIMLGLQEELSEIDDLHTWALVLNSIGITYRRLGDYESAIQNYQEVVSVSEDQGFSDLPHFELME